MRDMDSAQGSLERCANDRYDRPVASAANYKSLAQPHRSPGRLKVGAKPSSPWSLKSPGDDASEPRRACSVLSYGRRRRARGFARNHVPPMASRTPSPRREHYSWIETAGSRMRWRTDQSRHRDALGREEEEA